MDEPQGALPPSVYRRRRAIATAGTAAVVIVVIWAAGALLGSSGTIKGTANDNPNGAAAAASPSNPPPSGRLSQAGAPSSSASATPAPLLPPAPSTTAAATTTPPPPPPPPPPACPDNVIQLIAGVSAPSYPVGSRPVFTLHVTNTGPTACTRDVSHQFRSLVVVPAGGGNPLWSSSDCYTLTTHEVPLLQPGQVISYNVDWAGRTSAPGCPRVRTVVPAGQYALIARLGNLASEPTPFALTAG